MSVGIQIMEEILGKSLMERRAMTESPFNSEMRRLTEEFCFEKIWARGGLSRKTRSMLVLAMMAAVGRNAELKVHVAGAITNGCTVEEIKEVLLQAAVYAGIPAGVEAFKIAEDTLKEVGVL